MAKVSMINREMKRQKLVERFSKRRASLKEIVRNKELPMEERFRAQIKLAKLPPNSSPSRLHNRCKITGRPKGYMRVFGISRVMFREMANNGLIPGIKKSSW